MIYPNSDILIKKLGSKFLGPTAKKINPGRWQGLEIQNTMIEIFDIYFRVEIPKTIEDMRRQCSPDLPWADDHFDERVFGVPTNPGATFKQWPFYKEDSYRKGIFSHTYQERFWPKFAGKDLDGLNPLKLIFKNSFRPNKGIRFEYGDLNDLINHLSENPGSRQAYLPIWFPEDTGVIHKGRVPCSLGYLFSYRDGFLHLSYDLRSCDYIRHFRNDLYMAYRLVNYVLFKLRQIKGSPIDWNKVELGILSFHITSFHIFESDLYELKKRIK
ncbi:MAG: hypothetical protein ACRCU6_02190 [Fusobacteriaceae bacterium]